jgi:hypothetical protein
VSADRKGKAKLPKVRMPRAHDQAALPTMLPLLLPTRTTAGNERQLYRARETGRKNKGEMPLLHTQTFAFTGCGRSKRVLHD